MTATPAANPEPTAATAPGVRDFLQLDPDQVVRTIFELCERIERRFPGSGLGGLSRKLLAVATKARERSEWIARPILTLRLAVGVLLFAIVVGLVGTIRAVGVPKETPGLFNLVQVLEAGINDLVLLAAGVFFLVTLETRIKRRRALAAVNELRAIAHIIDMHQLTKDPEWILARGPETVVQPRRRLTPFELSRYLDYCSEMLSLTGKVAALYTRGFDDDVALSSVNEVEALTTGLSRKIWQKLMILYTIQGAADGRATRPPQDAEGGT
jgi:hypothetical protein